MTPTYRPIASAPHDATWFVGRMADGTERPVHFAQDLSGSEQPAFSGFFYAAGSGEYVECDPVDWRPETATEHQERTREVYRALLAEPVRLLHGDGAVIVEPDDQ